MAEMSRCGRRKQRNPRRKNVEEEAPILNNGTSLGTASSSEGQVASPKPASCSQHCNDASDENSVPDDSALVENTEDDIKQAANMDATNNTESVNGSVETDKKSTMLAAEEDKIQEFMSRSDTAVIFPEPVSDQEDDTSDRKGDLLKEQISGHRGNKIGKYSCPQCDDCFVLKSQLEKHLPVHSPLSQNCKICHKTFANVYRLQRHMISHDESSGLRKFKCPECGKAFKFKHHLKEHIRIHSGEKPFECSNCGKRFSHSGSYSSHMTSKKCWVMGVKMRKPDKMPEETENSVRGPLVPKPEQGPLEIQMPTMYASQYPDYVQPFVAPFDPAALQSLPPHLLAQMTRTHPYMPFGGYAGSHLVKAVSAYVPTSTPAHQNSQPLHPTHINHSDRLKESKVTEERDDAEVVKAERYEGGPEASQDQNTKEDDSVKVKSETSGDSELSEVKKVLEKIDATVSQQQKSKDDKTSISKLGSAIHDVISHDRTPESLVDKAREALKRHLRSDEDIKSSYSLSTRKECRFCKETFVGPIDLHQHERYLCKKNTEIHGQNSEMHSKDMYSRACSPDLASQSTEGTNDDDVDDDETLDKDGLRCRVRSMINEEQLQVLRKHYQNNPRPRKFELVRIANDIGFSKRVVQVWFQNMRARDRKKGIDVPYFPSMARFPNQDQSSVSASSPTTQYIPIVPQPYSAPSLHSSPKAFYSTSQSNKVNGTLYTPPIHNLSGSVPYSLQMEPLDLSKKPQPAHTHSSASKATVTATPGELEEGVLNLSQKSGRSQEAVPQKTSSRLEHSAIFEYLKEEGLFPKSSHNNNNTVPSNVIKNDISSGGYAKIMETNNNIPHVGDLYGRHTPDRPQSRNFSSTSSPPPAHSPNLPPKTSTPVTEYTADNLRLSSERLPDSLNSSFNSSSSGSLDQTINGFKPKRNRKKSWRQWNGSCIDDEQMMWYINPKRMADICYQSSPYNPLCGYMFKMEAEQVQLDFEDNVSVDDDQPCRKKRKSWKHHKVDVEEGMYACDQCEKMFSKQSSLARHKYEHSGARPFSCDICTKAFKHKHHLTEHKRLHSGEKPFQCKKCGKRFSHSGSFSQHMNHRYKYCKPNQGDGEADEEQEDSDSA